MENNQYNSGDHYEDHVYSNYQTTLLRGINIASIVFALLVCIGSIFGIVHLKMLKPVPIILMIIYIHQMNQNKLIVPRLIQYGLIAGLFGDVLLMFTTDIFFIFGTIFFLIGHLIYIKAYLTGQSYRQISTFGFWARIAGIVVLCGVYLFNMYNLMIKGKFPIPIFFQVYGAILTAMMITSTFRYEKTVDKSFFMVLSGALLFGISDSFLSRHRFIEHNDDNSPILVILTYYASQYLIMHGSLIHPPSKEDKQMINSADE